MKEALLPVSTKRVIHTASIEPSRSSSLGLRFVAWCAVAAWRMCVDWRTKRPLLTRAAAHISIVVLALATIVFSGIGGIAPRAAIGGSLDAGDAFAGGGPPGEPGGALLPTSFPLDNWIQASNADTVARLPNPHTDSPERVRAQVGTYVVQTGDTIYAIAAHFGLSPETIVWSNREAINDAPWLINPGLELFILPVDGVYHTVLAGETVADIAAEYEVEPAVLYNEWNDLEEEDQLREGQLLIVPGGKGPEVTWTPPPRYPRPGPVGLSYGLCRGVQYTGPGASGGFILPTGSYAVSGWYFHDPRNPTHIGLDYRCRKGDPIMAADNGVVTVAGWNGGYGIMAEVNHGNGFVTRYAHFSSLAVGCGQSVYQGDLLGYCGSTGISSGPHLHFEIRLNGVPQDPAAYQP